MSSWDMIDSNITISILMPAYNAAEYIREAIDSILNQTFTNFEFVIINDGSTDATEEIILSYSDERIQYYANECNIGIVKTLNRGIDLCRGKYIARMDADDVSLPNRLEKQVRCLETNPHIVACGVLYAIYGDQQQTLVDVATDMLDVRYDMAIYCQFAHSMVMMRKDVLNTNQLQYREEYKYAEDYKLWTELLQFGEMINIPDVLGYIRQCEEGISISNAERQRNLSDRVRKEYLNQLGVKTQLLLSDVLNEESISSEVIRETLCAYYPLVLQAKSYNWLFQNYKTALKKYLRYLPLTKKIKEISYYWKGVLNIKDKLAILLK